VGKRGRLRGSAFVKETLCSNQEASCENNDSRRPIARLDILSSSKIDQLLLTPWSLVTGAYHSGSRMEDGHML
jgi:hypothetical protein